MVTHFPLRILLMIDCVPRLLEILPVLLAALKLGETLFLRFLSCRNDRIISIQNIKRCLCERVHIQTQQVKICGIQFFRNIANQIVIKKDTNIRRNDFFQSIVCLPLIDTSYNEISSMKTLVHVFHLTDLADVIIFTRTYNMEIFIQNRHTRHVCSVFLALL